MTPGWSPLLLAAAVLAACSSDSDESGKKAAIPCSLETRDDDYRPGLEKAAGSVAVRLLDATPAPPIKGDNVWTVQVVDTSGRPVTGATLKIAPWMPDHKHGTAVRARVEALPEGRYRLNPVNLFMPALWEVRVEVGQGTAKPETATFSFCIEG